LTRRVSAAAAAGLLLALLLVRQSPLEVRRRAVSLASFAPRELAVRRLGGSATAFDRSYFSFLENARRRLPASAEGVALVGVPSDAPYLYLANYQFAPLPVLASPDPVPSHWIVVVYGTNRPPGARLLAEWAGGALMEPSP
jgi:hypothetical protein